MRFNIDKKTNEPVASFDDIAKKFDEMNAELEAKKQEFRDMFSAQLTNIFSAFFQLAPKIKSVTWTQYTPYFMDGDECVFSLNTIFLSTNLNEDFDTYPDFNNGADDWSLESYSIKRLSEEYLSSTQKDACNKLVTLLNQNDDMLKGILGDHLQVRVTREGMDTEEYEHD